MAAREWLMLLALAALWGGSFFFNGVAVRELPSLTLVWLRVSVAAVALMLALRVTGQRVPGGWREWLAFGGMGLLHNVLPFALIVSGQHRTASGLAAIPASWRGERRGSDTAHRPNPRHGDPALR